MLDLFDIYCIERMELTEKILNKNPHLTEEDLYNLSIFEMRTLAKGE